MLIATASNGLIFGLFSGQPLMIFGSTGPFLVFEEMIFNVTSFLVIKLKEEINNLISFFFSKKFCKHKLCIEFLPARFWVALWVFVYTLIITAFEGVFIV